MYSNYENKYVAFLDVLGFKNMVEQSKINPLILNKINRALDYTQYIQTSNYEGKFPMSDFGKQVSVFSDSIIISYNVRDPGCGFYVLIDLINICNDLLSVDMPVRGGVTAGLLIHESNKCFGPAMVNAYLMESKQAKYPRILIDPKVIEYDLKYRGENNSEEFERGFITSLIDQDNVDNEIYLNYLAQYDEFDDFNIYTKYMYGVKQFIINSLQYYFNDNKVFEKYQWMKEYYNKTVKSIYKNPSELIIH